MSGEQNHQPQEMPESIDVVTLTLKRDNPGNLIVRGSGSAAQMLTFLNQAAEMMRAEVAVETVVARQSRIVKP